MSKRVKKGTTKPIPIGQSAEDPLHDKSNGESQQEETVANEKQEEEIMESMDITTYGDGDFNSVFGDISEEESANINALTPEESGVIEKGDNSAEIEAQEDEEPLMIQEGVDDVDGSVNDSINDNDEYSDDEFVPTRTLVRYSMAESVARFVKRHNSKEIFYDELFQRGLCWSLEKKRLLILSVLLGLPVPELFFVKQAKHYSVIDGKQRGNALADFINEKFRLDDESSIVFDDSGAEVDLSGLLFNELPEDIQQRIKDYQLQIVYYDDLEYAEKRNMFLMLNNGKNLTASQKRLASISSLREIVSLASHEIFSLGGLTDKDKLDQVERDIVQRTIIALYCTKPDFTSVFMGNVMATFDITDDIFGHITGIYSFLTRIHQKIHSNGGDDGFVKIAKRMVNKKNIPMMAIVANKAIKAGVAEEKFTEWALRFFTPPANNKRMGTRSVEYNQSSNAGASKPENIEKRIKAIMSDYNGAIM